MKRFLPIIFLLILIVLTTSLFAQEIKLDVKEHTLKNGMKILILENHRAPVFSTYTYYKVGSANEVPGIIGAAHLLEHLLFKGTKTIGTKDYQKEKALMDKEDSLANLITFEKRKQRFLDLEKRLGKSAEDNSSRIEEIVAGFEKAGNEAKAFVVPNEMEKIYTENGAAGFNAMTGYDQTSYFVSFPSNRLELFFALEADRIQNAVFREFYSERDVVLEERRLSVDNEPASKLFEQLIATSFVAHPYQVYWEWKSEIANLTRKEIEDFYRKYYAPNRMVLAIVGDINPDEVIKLAEEYFAPIPSQTETEPIVTVEPEQLGEKRVEVEFDANPEIYIAYHKTAFDDSDEVIFKVLDQLLSRGMSSRLYKNLVDGKKIALDVQTSEFPGSFLGALYPDIFIFDGIPKAPHTAQELEDGIFEEIEKLKTQPVDLSELEKIKNNLESDFIWQFYSNSGMAAQLANLQGLCGDWRYLDYIRKRIQEISPEDIMRVAKKYFTQENRTVAILKKKASG